MEIIYGLFAGSHKERFGADGKGKGLEGREEIIEDDGYVVGYTNKDTYDKDHEWSESNSCCNQGRNSQGTLQFHVKLLDENFVKILYWCYVLKMQYF